MFDKFNNLLFGDIRKKLPPNNKNSGADIN